MSPEAAVELVKKFLAAQAPTWTDLMTALRTYCAPDVVHENTGMPTVHGPEAIIDLWSQFREKTRFETMEYEYRSEPISDGVNVAAERYDIALGQDGRVVVRFPVMGLFTITDGKISAWRDYLNLADVAWMLDDSPSERGSA